METYIMKVGYGVFAILLTWNRHRRLDECAEILVSLDGAEGEAVKTVPDE